MGYEFKVQKIEKIDFESFDINPHYILYKALLCIEDKYM